MLTKVSAGVLNVDDLYGFRNRIINGDMRIDQRNNGASLTVNTGTPVYTLDRFAAQAINSAGAFTVQQSATAPSGFVNSLLATVTTTDASPASRYRLFQNIEGLNVSDLGWGTANAQAVALSFWVRSSVTGTFGGALQNSGSTRSYPFTFTVSSANTFEYKTVIISGDTTGTWLTTNGVGIGVSFSLGANASLSGTAGVWAGADYRSATGATNLMATSGATFYITGVQLEKGSVATEFERRPYGTELALCQRYAQLNTAAMGKASTGGGLGAFFVPMMVQMRAAPTVTLVTGTNRVDQLYTSQRTVSSVFSIFGNDTAGTALSVELNVTSLGANSQCTLFGGTLLMSSEL